MLLPLMWLLAVSIAISGIAVFLTVRLRQRKPQDLEASSSSEKVTQPTESKTDERYSDSDPGIGAVELPESITASNIERAAWVLRMTRHVFSERHSGRYNVVVINNDLEYHFNPQNVVEKFTVEFQNSKRPWVVPYSIVVFDEGTLLNMGDGGDINWDWQGNFTRSGNKLLSFNPCISGVAYKQDPWNAV